jgi:hypothetical protein
MESIFVNVIEWVLTSGKYGCAQEGLKSEISILSLPLLAVERISLFGVQ